MESLEEKKIELILSNLSKRRELNDLYCNINDCPPTKYIEGSNKVLDEMIIFVNNLK